jgi:hypothetical protein
VPLEVALLEYTNFYVRFGLGREFNPDHEGWQSYVAGLRGAEDGREWTYHFYLSEPEAKTAPPVVATFGCFSYAVPDGSHVRLHFRNTEADGCSPLSTARIERRRAELAVLFTHMKTSVSQDTPVVGASWLYNLRAYRRLLPPGYVSTARPIRGGFRSMPLWGQFLNRHGEVRESMAESFLNALAQTSNLSDVGKCFPFQALTATAPVRQFYDFYEVNKIAMNTDLKILGVDALFDYYDQMNRYTRFINKD